MQDLSASRRSHSGMATKPRRTVPRNSPRCASKNSSHKPGTSPRNDPSRSSLKNAVGSNTSPRIAISAAASRSPAPTHSRAAGPFGRPPQPVTRSSTSPGPSHVGRCDTSPHTRNARCRSPTPDAFQRTALVPSQNGIKAARLRSPTSSMIPPVVQSSASSRNNSSFVAASPTRGSPNSSFVAAPPGELSRTWSFPGPPRPGRDASPQSRLSPTRMASNSPSSDRLSRSWAYRPSASATRPGQENLEGTVAATSERCTKRRAAASSSVTLPVCLPRAKEISITPPVRRHGAESSELLDGLASDSVLSIVRPSERASSPPIPSRPRPVSQPGSFCSAPQPQNPEKAPASEDVAASRGLTGAALLRAAMSLTLTSQADAAPAQVRAVSSNTQVAPTSDTPSPLSPSNGKNLEGRSTKPSAAQCKTGPDVEENQDPNTAVDIAKEAANKVEASSTACQQKSAIKAPPKSAEIQQNATATVASDQQGTRSTSPRRPPNCWYDKSVLSPEETWIRMDGLRVRMEMLPGGLVVERDQNITDVAALMAEMQNGQTEASSQVLQSQAYKNHADILAKLARLSELVEAVEAEYWRWCKDQEAPPLDMVAKQQVHDWLVTTGEKAVILSQLRDLGARRCLGTVNSWSSEPEESRPCGRFLQYGLYKQQVRRCPACSKEWKRLVAHCASEALRCSHLDAEGVTSEEPGRSRTVSFSEMPPPSIDVEARELAWAVYAACPGTYFRAWVLPSDLEIAKESGNPVNVSWLDGDRRHRSVATKDVIMMEHPSAADVKGSNAATWCKETQSLMPNLRAIEPRMKMV